MNPLLETKLSELEAAEKYSCWYLVKQPTSFDNICYLVSFLNEYKNSNQSINLESFIELKIDEVNTRKPNVEISNNYRALRVAAFFGLIVMVSSKYEESIITDTFEEITERCNGEYENTSVYSDIIERQIEKIYISSKVDEAYETGRKEYRLFPVMLLYKLLVELGKNTGEYKITMTEYRYLVTTTKKYSDFLDTLILIKLLRENPNANEYFEQYKEKFDNRLIQALKQLPALQIDREQIILKAEYRQSIANKVFVFENSMQSIPENDYLDFLGSTKGLFDNIEPFDETNSEEKAKATRLAGGENRLYYGVPGAGKSHAIDDEIGDCKYERVVFHPDYTYSDFVGQIMPKLKAGETGEKKLSYEFVPGPFTKALDAAINNPREMFYLVIEEINRGNAPAIFGDVFQLLDRNEDGTGKYHITNFDIAREVYGDETKAIKLPSNLSIYATMNTSDQNVFTLDTAFQRRWHMKYVRNDISKATHAKDYIDHSGVTWEGFATTINKEIVEYNAAISSSEDKQLGAYFVKKNELNKDVFPEKVLKYLWDDAFKLDREQVFNHDIKSIGDVIEKYHSAIERHEDPLKSVIRAEVYKRMSEEIIATSEDNEKETAVEEN